MLYNPVRVCVYHNIINITRNIISNINSADSIPMASTQMCTSVRYLKMSLTYV